MIVEEGSKRSSGQTRTVLLNASYAPSLINFRGTLIQAMIASGYDVHVSAPDIDVNVIAQLGAIGATPHEIHLARSGLSPVKDFKYAWQLRKLVREIRADLVISYTIKPNVWGSLAAGRAGARSASMVTGLGYAFIEGRGLKRRLLGLTTRFLYRLATGFNEVVIFQNADDRDDFITAGCLRRPDKARLVNGSGVDTEAYASASLPDEAIFLMTARLLIDKGAREYAEAALDILGRRRDCKFLLAGFLDDRPNCITPDELVAWQSKGLEFLGKLDDVRPAIAGASVFVLPSYREGTPRSVLEAMAMGRPIITTDVPGCRETVIEEANGLLVPPRNVPALVAAMERLIDDPELRSAMGARSREICEQKFDVKQVNEVLMMHLSL